MDYPERERQFDAVEAPQHRLHIVGMAEALLANMPAVQRGLAEMSMEAPQIAQESYDNPTDLDAYRKSKIVAASEKDDAVEYARLQAEDAYHRLKDVG